MTQRDFANLTWPEATFLQACYDFKNGRTFFEGSLGTQTYAVATAQFQQCAEKAMKSMVLLDSTKKGGNADSIIFDLMRHDIWTAKISHEPELRGIRKRLLDKISPYTEQDILELELRAPQGNVEIINTEYPWRADKRIVVPARFFGDSEELVEKYMGLAGAVFGDAAAYSPKFSKIKESFDEEFGK